MQKHHEVELSLPYTHKESRRGGKVTPLESPPCGCSSYRSGLQSPGSLQRKSCSKGVHQACGSLNNLIPRRVSRQLGEREPGSDDRRENVAQ